MEKLYWIVAAGLLITAGILVNGIKNDQRFAHCIQQAAELDGKLTTTNQAQNVHYLATEYAAMSLACKDGIPKLLSKPIADILADAKKPETIAEGKKKADERKNGNPLL
jgi:hypothetical protein